MPLTIRNAANYREIRNHLRDDAAAFIEFDAPIPREGAVKQIGRAPAKPNLNKIPISPGAKHLKN